jgi:hypothetical protein
MRITSRLERLHIATARWERRAIGCEKCGLLRDPEYWEARSSRKQRLCEYCVDDGDDEPAAPVPPADRPIPPTDPENQ